MTKYTNQEFETEKWSVRIEDQMKDEKQSENAIIGRHNEDCTN